MKISSQGRQINELTGPSLRTNRDFQLLWLSQALSALGSRASFIALPLLVLTTTNSSTRAGLVGFVMSAAALAARLPGGALADRYSRRKTMLCCNLVRGAAMVLFATALTAHRPLLLLLIVAATIEGAVGSLYASAAMASLPSIVTVKQLPSAVASNQARAAAAGLAGPPVGGFLFGLSHSMPFFANAVSYTISFVCILLVRAPLDTCQTKQEKISLRGLVAGFPFLWSHPFIRDTLVVAAMLNFAFSSIFFAAIVMSVDQGSSSLSTGLLVAFANLGILVGAMIAPKTQRMLTPRQLLLAICWITAALVPLMALNPATFILGAMIAVCTLLASIATVVTTTSRLLLTPDHLQGRIYGAAGLIATSTEALGLLVTGALLDLLHTSTFFVLAGLFTTLAFAATLSKGLQQAPPAVTP